MQGRCDPQCEYYENRPATELPPSATPSKIQEMAYETKVSDAMSPGLITVTPETPMTDVREILRKNRISGLPVIQQGKLLGIISLENFITCLMKGSIHEHVGNNMTPNVEYLYADEPLIHAIGKFEKLGYGRFPVLERGEETLVGILTKGDVIQCLLENLHVSYYEEEIHKYRASHLFEDITSIQTTLTLRHKIPGGMYKLAGRECGQLKKNLLRLGIAPQIARRVTVAACETEMNIIVFTDGGDMTVEVEADHITVNASDHGPGIADLDKAMQPGFSTAPDWVREMGFGAGMGLPNIKNCADEMYIDSTPANGTHLKFTVFLKA